MNLIVPVSETHSTRVRARGAQGGGGGGGNGREERTRAKAIIGKETRRKAHKGIVGLIPSTPLMCISANPDCKTFVALFNDGFEGILERKQIEQVNHRVHGRVVKNKLKTCLICFS